MQIERFFHDVTGLSWRIKKIDDGWVHDLTITHNDHSGIQKKTCIAFVGKKLITCPPIAKHDDVWTPSSEVAIWVEEVVVSEPKHLEDSYATRLNFSGEGSTFIISLFSKEILPNWVEIESDVMSDMLNSVSLDAGSHE